MKARADIAAKNIERTKKPIRDHNVKAKEPAEPVAAPEYHGDLAAAYRAFGRLAASQAARQRGLKAHSDRLTEAREVRHDQARERLKDQKAHDREQFSHLEQRQQHMNNLIVQVKEAFKEEVD